MQNALEHHQAGRFADAAREYQVLLTRDPDDVAVLHLFGVLHQQSGFPARAVELIGRAIALRPDIAVFHSNLAEAYRSLGDPGKAVECCRAALALEADFPEADNHLGLALHDLGRPEDAITHYDVAIRSRPGDATIRNNRGTSRLALGQTVEALEDFTAATRLDPEMALARSNLGQLLTDLGRPAEGFPECREAVRLRPDFPAARNNLGNALLALERWEEARESFAEAVRLDPGLATAHANLGVAIQRGGRPAEAIPHLRRAIELEPEDPEFRRKLAVAFGEEENWAEAVAASEERARLDPGNPDALGDLGWAYHSDERQAEAEAAYLRALESQPDHQQIRLNFGLLREEQGRLDEAEACYREAEARNPDSPLPLAHRAVLLRGGLADADRDRLRFHLYAPSSLHSRMHCLFALAQVADARGDHAEAAACLAPANALAALQRRSLGQTYDPDEHARHVDQLIAGFTPALFRRLDGSGDDRARPIFVFGMPRSGTTLVEQLLSSHGRVHGAGELPLVRKALDTLPPALARPDAPELTFPDLDADTIRRMAGDYSRGVRNLVARQGVQGDPDHVVDKLPDNYLYLGLIALMFPGATLIHVRRDPRDVAVSCWMNHFRSIRWSDELGHLARRFREHRRVMDHWRATLPLVIHEVEYERLVDDFEPEARRLLAACGLDWEPRCLQFHQTSRTVRTASVSQVRQPIYRKSLARWKAYQPHLSSLFDQLAGD